MALTSQISQNINGIKMTHEDDNKMIASQYCDIFAKKISQMHIGITCV